MGKFPPLIFFIKKLKSKKLGLTFIEIIMVMIIIGILSIVTINRVQSSYGIKLDLAAKKIISDFRYAQNLAVSNHEEVYIEFSTANDTYEIYKWEGLAKVYYTHPHTREPFVVDFMNDYQFSGIDIISVDFDGDVVLRFSSLGKPRNNTGDDLLNTGQINFLYKDIPLTIVVTPETGFCQKQ